MVCHERETQGHSHTDIHTHKLLVCDYILLCICTLYESPQFRKDSFKIASTKRSLGLREDLIFDCLLQVGKQIQNLSDSRAFHSVQYSSVFGFYFCPACIHTQTKPNTDAYHNCVQNQVCVKYGSTYDGTRACRCTCRAEVCTTKTNTNMRAGRSVTCGKPFVAGECSERLLQRVGALIGKVSGVC